MKSYNFGSETKTIVMIFNLSRYAISGCCCVRVLHLTNSYIFCKVIRRRDLGLKSHPKDCAISGVEEYNMGGKYEMVKDDWKGPCV